MNFEQIKFNIKFYTRLVKDKKITNEVYKDNIPSYQIKLLNEYKASLRKYQAMLPLDKMNFEKFSKKFKEKNDTLENVKKLSREIWGKFRQAYRTCRKII